ncbi:cysteine--tRNA ligase [Candidatus Symbiobacter mobilis]|uniref:Cysteine--tRNA ligase n=1 Tax=Candidatus Symbiobacter mobilis CR TaxID=946483 RepID=U5N5E4_9BURK|nr:cysteine--tRNA ligase [Candidatus Symbiobacter mobilis]AGX86736.1 cysteinyl-tRNA synthetase [Candidatus Symbiobacter mobilis CR]
MGLHLYNSLTRSLEPFVPQRPGHVSMYVCGMTVYDLCHLGHARSMVAFDVIRRWLQESGYCVTFVRNITDIDDKILRRAAGNGESLRTLTDRMIAAMHEDADALGVLRPTEEPRATEYVPAMQALIGRLQEQGFAYRSADGDMHYAVRRFAGYGRLSGKSLAELRAGERVGINDNKADPLDFVLWKSAKDSDPAEARWDSPFGVGRPGWHIECSAMCASLLGQTIDIHGGGVDLQFPHHDNEIAQSEAAHGVPLARYWLHNGFVTLGQEKMSKSLGNVSTIRDILQHVDAETLRFFLLRSHYRSDVAFTGASLDDARLALRRLYGALAAVPVDAAPAEASTACIASMASIDGQEPYAARFRKAMDQDFGTPEAVAVLFDLASEVHRSHCPRLAGLLRSLGGCLGILQQEPASYLQGGAAVDRADIEARIAQRAQAKASKDFAWADRIRAELLAQGIALRDTPSGTTWESVSRLG